ncbi:ADP-ribosylglycohydrolase family protein [Chitinophaga sp. Cy-1792]|uniref:ADP-ribosylglycohydrolase family protein n=1 Tax=Chitinophaga sp. Cy-1792 TaxID=2608339 RepID=UPI00141FF1DF|nr:ADP-ribosylglycohydrolase family protein [Chitinophaga sp. Cy-1792]NIG56849.1 ADP-ribosylglycohydrolase family protein [Chitinophaga sp. Cy-1792]
MLQQVSGTLFGVAIGDALGVPVEFKTLAYLQNTPVTDMIGYGSWNQPPGTFSDDTSLTLCTAESLIGGYDINNMAQLFVKWYGEAYWTAHNNVFDIGHTTRRALHRVATGTSPLVSGGFEDFENGNGSLMRISPLVFQLANEMDIEKRYQMVKEVSTITHQHFRSVFACFIYVEFLRILLVEKDIFNAYQRLQHTIHSFLAVRQFNPNEIKLFKRVLQDNLASLKEQEINASGYVIHTLESAIWCFLTTKSYEECVLKAVNLGEDTDTTGAVAGALAGIYYGHDAIPTKWIDGVARSSDISQLAQRFAAALNFQPA